VSTLGSTSVFSYTWLYVSHVTHDIQSNPTIFGLWRLSFRANLGPKAQKWKFSKIEKKTPDIHPRNKCIKFQSNPTIFGLCRLSQSFSDRQTDRHAHTHTHIHTLSDSSSTEVENNHNLYFKSFLLLLQIRNTIQYLKLIKILSVTEISRRPQIWEAYHGWSKIVWWML